MTVTLYLPGPKSFNPTIRLLGKVVLDRMNLSASPPERESRMPSVSASAGRFYRDCAQNAAGLLRFQRDPVNSYWLSGE